MWRALEEVAAEVRALGREAHVVACDVIEEAQVKAMVAKALELGKYGINVNAVCPGIVETPRMMKLCEGKARKRGWTVEQVYEEYVQDMALKRVTTPQDIANAVLFAASEDSRAMTGQELAIDGGWDV
jgi:NAD(P)-dependent dehydrogenase (short-subunit alcohol dehydrogenase family)